jgi:hypothetical protein
MENDGSVLGVAKSSCKSSRCKFMSVFTLVKDHTIVRIAQKLVLRVVT